MSWQAYKIVLHLRSPMHMGRAKLGNLQVTRPYVHGKALWGALTARMTRDTPSLNNDYREVGRRVNRELAFSYFYPTTGSDVELWSWDDAERFAWHFLGSYASTALNYRQNSAEEGSLHETEFIAPTTREGKSVYLLGYIFEQGGCALPWKDALLRLQMGGERTYGWGRGTLYQEPLPVSTLFGRYDLELDGGRPVVSIEKNGVLLAHTRAHGEGAILANGRVVPLVGRETHSANKHGRHVPKAAICWEPGGTVDEEMSIQISDYGIWKAA
ncbi:MAG: CRISPR-associated protein [Chloroflexi bacterium]|nr:CRISPR-associated protein [Chloroflexota bacterium]